MREATADRLTTTWVEVKLRRDEIGEAFNGIDPLRPVFREKLEAIREHLTFLNMEVVLRDPLPEELDEMRGWLPQE